MYMYALGGYTWNTVFLILPEKQRFIQSISISLQQSLAERRQGALAEIQQFPFRKQADQKFP